MAWIILYLCSEFYVGRDLGRDVYTVDCRHMSTKSILCLPKPGRLAVYQSTKFGRRAPRVYQSTKFSPRVGLTVACFLGP